MKCCYLAAFAAVTWLAVGGGDEATKKDLDQMQGAWHAIKNVTNGKEMSDKENKDADVKLVVKGETYTIFFAGQKFTEGKLKLNAAKAPRELDAIADDGPFKGQAMPGVYKYEGKDEMLVNFGQPGKARPDDFTCKEGSDRILITYKRAK